MAPRVHGRGRRHPLRHRRRPRHPRRLARAVRGQPAGDRHRSQCDPGGNGARDPPSDASPAVAAAPGRAPSGSPAPRQALAPVTAPASAPALARRTIGIGAINAPARRRRRRPPTASPARAGEPVGRRRAAPVAGDRAGGGRAAHRHRVPDRAALAIARRRRAARRTRAGARIVLADYDRPSSPTAARTARSAYCGRPGPIPRRSCSPPGWCWPRTATRSWRAISGCRPLAEGVRVSGRRRG